MKVLIIDDSDYKVEGLTSVLRHFDPLVELFTARSYRTGRRMARQVQPDLILLDMSLPTFDVSRKESGGRTRPFGGREILRDLDSSQDLTHFIVVTQWDRFGERGQSRDTLMKEVRAEFTEWFIGGVHYSVVDSHWREELCGILQKLKE